MSRLVLALVNPRNTVQINRYVGAVRTEHRAPARDCRSVGNDQHADPLVHGPFAVAIAMNNNLVCCCHRHNVHSYMSFCCLQQGFSGPTAGSGCSHW